MLQRIFQVCIFMFWWILFIGSGFLFRHLNMYSETKKARYLIFFAVALLTYVTVEIISALYVMKKINRLRPLLVKNGGNPQLYINKINKLLKWTSNPTLRNYCYINLSAAYDLVNDYRTSAEYLHKVNIKYLEEPALTNYWIAYIEHHFEAGEYYFALQCMDNHAAQLNQYRNHVELGGYIAVLELYRKLALNQTENLARELETVRRNWPSKYLVDDLNLIEERMIENGLK